MRDEVKKQLQILEKATGINRKIDENKLDSKIYGSIKYGWNKVAKLNTFGDQFGYQGDGVTKSFVVTSHSRVQLNHWTWQDI